jgi:heterodisulfide reductase subunit A
MDIRGEPPRLGVFICCCGTNIAGVVDVPALVAFAQTLPGVVYAEQNLFSCAQDSQEKLAQIIRDRNLNKVVVAACTPRTHEPLFQETLANAGLNKYLFEMANIRNQCSWVHQHHPEQATQKAKDLVRMAAAKAVLLQPLAEPTLEISQQALVIGGGLAGLSAARTLADQGFKTYLLEKGAALGGQARQLHQTWKGEEVQPYLNELIESISRDERIEVFLKAQVTGVDGFVGNFKTTIESDRDSRVLSHGVTLIASGASELKPDQYFYGKDPRVVTGMELQRRFIDGDPDLERIRTAVFVQCVGSRDPERPYCSRVCCTRSVKSALTLKEINPEIRVFILYRDMRTYGLREDLYREARQKGISFIRYDFEKGLTAAPDNGALTLSFTDLVLKRKMEVRPDLLVLASAIVPEKMNPLAQFYKVPQNADGFFVEAHVKLRPVDFATDGVFLCGLAQAPKSIDESITEAQGAAARAIALLSAGTISVTGTVAAVNPAACSSCGVCVSICPYSAPQFNEKTRKAQIEATLCKGCGLCTASCRSGAINLKGFELDQVMAMIESAL